jgi:TonB family protein
LTSQAQAGRGALAGIVQDPSGARVPGTEIAIKNLDGSNEEIDTVNAAGEYVFASIPAGRYSIEARVPGFKAAKAEAVVTAGAAARADINLEIGNIAERVKVHAPRTSPAPAAIRAQAAPQRIPIGGNVQHAKLLYKVDPEYPADLKQQGVTGTAVIRAIISKTGDVINAQVVNTVNPGLAKAALDAVKQWRHQPTLLNGEPVETVTTITISFDLDQ